MTPTASERARHVSRCMDRTRRAMAATLTLAGRCESPRPQVPHAPEAAHMLSSRYREVQGKFLTGENQDAQDTVSLWNLHYIAKDVSMSIDDVKLIHQAFDVVDRDNSGRLDINEFQEVVYNILLQQFGDPAVARERASSASDWYWWGRDTDQTGTISFAEFLKWYRSNGFKEDMLLTEDEQRMRQLAKMHNISTTYLDHIRLAFDTYDRDGSGSIDESEFEQVLHKALKMPAHVQLPPKRIKYFWAEIDTDASGKACFEEFLQWWLKYFSEDQSQKHQVDEFYKGIRRIGERFLDPPAYAVETSTASARDRGP